MTKIKPILTHYSSPIVNIKIDSIPDDQVVDIGGGGEGIIAQIGNVRVTAIENRQDEIDEAKPFAPSANWILADATDLPYADSHFDNATAFFSGMYMSMNTFDTVCSEVHRVLKSRGEFWIWDAKISKTEELFIIRLQITLPNGKKVNTGYGTKREDRSLNEIRQILLKNRFEISTVEDYEKWFFIKAKKK